MVEHLFKQQKESGSNPALAPVWASQITTLGRFHASRFGSTIASLVKLPPARQFARKKMFGSPLTGALTVVKELVSGTLTHDCQLPGAERLVLYWSE